MTDPAPANWYPDPFARFDVRYWDGARWTEHVVVGSSQSVDPPVMSAPEAPRFHPRPDQRPSKRIQREVESTGLVVGEQVGRGTLLTEPILVVNQRAKLIEVNAEYDVFDQYGSRIGVVREVGQNLLKKAVGADNFSTRRIHIVDTAGRTVISLIVPVTLIRTKVVVTDGSGREVGQIMQNFSILNVHFTLRVRGEVVGSINGEGWDSWDFNVQDPDGVEIARITKKWSGALFEQFTTKDNYVVEIRGDMESGLRTLIVAAALVVDVGLRQGQPQARAKAEKRARRWGDGGW